MSIVKRDIHFDLSNAPRFWCGDDKIATAFFNSLSICLPLAERYLIRSVLKFRRQIDDPDLQAGIAGFKIQEAIHTREHENYNERLRSQGYEIDVLEAAQAKSLDWFESQFDENRNLAMTACMEHFTSILSDAVLSKPSLFEGADPNFRDLWQWHALEEIEHSSVSFDVLQEIRPGYWYRCSTMLLATFEFAKLIGRNFKSMLKSDKNKGEKKGFLSVFNFLLGNPGFLRSMLIPYLCFYRPGFHPEGMQKKGIVKKVQLKIEQRMVRQAS